MDNIILTAPAKFIPPINTAAFKLLAILSDGKPHVKAEVLSVLGDDPRSARQALTGKTYGHWLIHNSGSKKAVYQLDTRHLSGDHVLDGEARIIAFKQLKDRSKKQSERETRRYPKALREQAVAFAIYQERFNFTKEEKPAPVI